MASPKLDFDKLRARCERIIAAHSQRNAMYEAMRRMVHMEWSIPPSARDDYVKETMSPDPYNTVMGVVRLMTSTDPKFSLNSSSDSEARRVADEIEIALDALWKAVNKRRRWPLHYEAVLSATMFSEVCIQVGNLNEVASFLNKTLPAEIQRAIEIVPFTLDVVNPSTVYPQYSPLGLRSVLRRYNRPIWEIRDFWGKLADKAGVGGGKDYEDDTLVEYCDYWDHEWRCVWTSDSKGPILQERHGLNFIPWVCIVTTGTSLFNEPERQRFPLLYPLWRGRWWERQNLMITQMYSVASAMMHPAWKVTSLSGKEIPAEFKDPGSQVILRPGENIEPLQKELIDPSVREALAMAEAKVTASTVPRVVFGETPGPNTAYAAINLLSQAGRLPLVPIERQVARAIGEAFELILQWASLDGQSLTLRDGMQEVTIDPATAAQACSNIQVQLKLDIPQDRLSLANVVTLLRNSLGPDKLPLISRKSALEMLGFLQATQETDTILSELFTGIELQKMLQGEVPHSHISNVPPPAPAEPVALPEQFDPARGGMPPVSVFPPIPENESPRGPVKEMAYG